MWRWWRLDRSDASLSLIFVRMALGATSGEILLSFGRRGVGLTLWGLAIGLVLAAIASRMLTTLLYGFRPDYIAVVTAVSLILATVAALPVRSGAPRLADRSDDCPAAGLGDARLPRNSD